MAKQAPSPMMQGELLPEGEVAGGEGGLNVDEALVAAAAETEGDITLGLDEGTVNKNVKFLNDFQQFGIDDNFIPSVTRVTPDVVTQLLLDAVYESACAIGLLQGVAAREGDGGLVIGNHLHQLVKSTLFPTPWIPRGRIVTTRATMIAARQVD